MSTLFRDRTILKMHFQIHCIANILNSKKNLLDYLLFLEFFNTICEKNILNILHNTTFSSTYNLTRILNVHIDC